MKTQNDSIKLQQNIIRLNIQNKGTDLEYVDGEIVTRNGIVSVQAQGTDNTFTRLDFSHNGRLHIRTFHGEYCSRRAIASRASEFAMEVSGNE